MLLIVSPLKNDKVLVFALCGAAFLLAVLAEQLTLIVVGRSYQEEP